jgi:hypothetical protein
MRRTAPTVAVQNCDNHGWFEWWRCRSIRQPPYDFVELPIAPQCNSGVLNLSRPLKQKGPTHWWTSERPPRLSLSVPGRDAQRQQLLSKIVPYDFVELPIAPQCNSGVLNLSGRIKQKGPTRRGAFCFIWCARRDDSARPCASPLRGH